MYATYDRLKELEKIGEANLRMTIENNIAQVINAFYDIAQQKQQMKATNQNISLYEEKLEIARKKLEIGSSSKLDFLQAKVDLNAQKSKFLSLKISMVTAKATLNQLLARPSDVDFDIEDTIVINYNPSIEELRKSALEQNTQLSIAKKNMQVANAVIRENESLLYPTIYFTPGYNFSLVKNQAGLVLLNQGLGFNAGGNLVYNIFNGSYATRNIQNAKISSYTSKLNYDFTKLQVETSVNKTFETFQNNLQLLKLEEDNTAIVNENVYVAFERFKIGSSSGIELKQAQQSLEDAQYRLINARFTTKLAETELLRLNGSLYKLLK
jgi:outer membrane protein TolC